VVDWLPFYIDWTIGVALIGLLASLAGLIVYGRPERN
jgi:hypothetical protein